MLRHTILFKVQPHISEPAINTALANFLQLKDKLPGLVAIAGGQCSFQQPEIAKKANNFFTHTFSMDFTDEDTLNTFFNDPITHPAKDGIVKITAGGYDGIIGFDLKV